MLIEADENIENCVREEETTIYMVRGLLVIDFPYNTNFIQNLIIGALIKSSVHLST